MKAPAAVAALAIAITSSALGAERLDCRYYRADEANPATTGKIAARWNASCCPTTMFFRPILATASLTLEALLPIMRASQPHRRATAPEQIEAALDARGEPNAYVGAVHSAETALADKLLREKRREATPA